MCHPKCKLDDLILVRLVIFNWFYLKRKISPSCNRILDLAFILNFSWQNAFLSGTINRQQIAHQFTKFYYPSLKSSIMELKNKKNPLVCRIFCDNNLRKALFCDNMMHLLYIWRSESNCLIYKNKKVNFLHLKIHASFCYFSDASCIFFVSRKQFGPDSSSASYDLPHPNIRWQCCWSWKLLRAANRYRYVITAVSDLLSPCCH